MDTLPTGSILLLILVDAVLVLGLSAFFGGYIARSVGGSARLGTLVGVLVPVVGPLAWAAVALVRTPGLAALESSRERNLRTWIVGVALSLAALLFLLATPLPWGDVSGSYDRYSLATDASPADTGVGLFATVGSAVVASSLVALLLMTSVWRRISIVVGWIGGFWLLVTLNSLIVFGALGDASDDLTGASGGRVGAEATAAGALWSCLIAAVVLLVAGAVIAIAPRRIQGASPGSSPPASPAQWAEAASEWAPPADEWGSAGGWNTPTTGQPRGPGANEW